mgnify:CR=1 FL=1
MTVFVNNVNDHLEFLLVDVYTVSQVSLHVLDYGVATEFSDLLSLVFEDFGENSLDCWIDESDDLDVSLGLGLDLDKEFTKKALDCAQDLGCVLDLW